MDLLDNPFFLLKAGPEDDRRRLTELADERLLFFADGAELLSRLTHPRRRLAAELAWLPGADPELTAEIIGFLESSLLQTPDLSKLDDLARANVLAARLARSGGEGSEPLIPLMTDLARAFELLDLDDLLETVNQQRARAGCPPLTDVEALNEELEERRLYFRGLMKKKAGERGTLELIDFLSDLVDWSTEDGQEPAPLLIDDLLGDYEVEALAFFEIEKANIRLLCELAMNTAPTWRSRLLGVLTEKLEVRLLNWARVTRPLSARARSEGREHGPSEEVASIVLDLSADLHNRFRKTPAATALNDRLLELFPGTSAWEVAKSNRPILYGALPFWKESLVQLRKLKPPQSSLADDGQGFAGLRELARPLDKDEPDLKTALTLPAPEGPKEKSEKKKSGCGCLSYFWLFILIFLLIGRCGSDGRRSSPGPGQLPKAPAAVQLRSDLKAGQLTLKESETRIRENLYREALTRLELDKVFQLDEEKLD